MKPADLILLIRQRSEWEAVDLGFALTQHVWRALFPAWAILLVSLAALCVLLIPQDYIWAAGIVIWWFKPFYDRVLLHILSRQLFGQKLAIAEVFSTLPYLIRNTGLLGALTWRRFSFSRSYNLPIWQLEQMRGDARKERHELLYLQGHGAAVALTITCRLLELIIALSIFGLIVVFDPTGQVWEHLKALFTGSSGSDIEYWLSLSDFVIQVFVILIIEPFFVAAGFSLYLNRRTQLEAWDIEITFRSLGERLKELAAKTTGTLIITLGLLSLSILATLPTQVQAAEDEFLSDERLPVSQSAEILEQVMQAEELSDIRQINTWVPRDKSDPDDQPKLSQAIIELISAVFKYLLWAAVLVLIVLGFVYRHKILALLKPPGKQAVQYEQPDVLFGMDIRPESLPDDIAGTAKTLWQKGKNRESLSLLYRGGLMQLTRLDSVRIADSHTEGDILKLAQPALGESPFRYLSKITRNWQTIAYAHRDPEDSEAESLFEQWPAFQRALAEQYAREQTPEQEQVPVNKNQADKGQSEVQS